MENKINIAEILKDCPKGMELDCTICDNVCLDEVTPNMIKCFVKNDVYNTIYFHHDGTYLPNPNSKCVIFPKGKTTWEGFQRPFRDGDILVGKCNQPFIFKKLNNYDGCFSYCGIDSRKRFLLSSDDCTFADSLRFATEEEKQKLFDAIKANGYKWNAETKTLEKLEVNKFNITTLKPFESRVLVRSSMDGLWKPAVFGFRNGYNDNAFYIVGGSCWKQCIPYLNNEHLCGTTNDCDEYFKTWE